MRKTNPTGEGPFQRRKMAGKKVNTSKDKKKQDKKKKRGGSCICRFFTSDPEEYGFLKFLFGLVFGAFLGLLFYVGMVERMTFPDEEMRYQFGGSVALLMSLGYALSVQVRCTLILVIPLFFGKHGRRIINAYAITFLLTGPMANMLANAKESSRSISCSSELAFEQSQTVMKFMAAPLMDTMKDLEKQAKDLDKYSSKVKKEFKPVETEVEEKEKGMTAGKNQNTETKYKDKTSSRCKELMSSAQKKCKEALRKVPNCWSILGLPVCFDFEALGTCAAVAGTMCSSNKAVDKGFGKNYESTERSNKELDKHFDAKMEYQIISRPKDLNLKTAEDVGLAIDQEFRSRMAVFRLISSAINKIFAFLFVLTILAAHTYQRKFCTKFDFDNLYITGYFRRIDARRRKAGKRTLLPLKKAEENEIIYPSRMKLMSHEKQKLTKGLIMVFGQIVFALVVFFLDYLLFESLDIIRRHSEVTTIMKGHHQLSVKVLGKGALARIMDNLFRSLKNQEHTLHHVSTNKRCLPHPTELDPWYLWLVLGIYIAQIGLYYMEAYALRLRRVIASFFYRRRAKKRTLYLYNEFMRKRVGFLTHMRKKIRRLVREKKLSIETALPTILRYKFPLLFGWLKWFGLGKKQCLICDDKENKLTHHCPGCRYVYCRQCWRDLKKACYYCNPADTSEDTQTSDKSSSSEED
ncbi:DCST1 [Branchiostoma lanceolatum]|uniref:DCST1 protein n=3 Tax=Branchiostoma lanceolatum TaxID=7740 RepID=A0A8J9ZBH2_BRALA|nr:DCST1 [Branchiostoma lanceolatum]